MVGEFIGHLNFGFHSPNFLRLMMTPIHIEWHQKVLILVNPGVRIDAQKKA